MELETITKVPVERLRLDRRNPRLHAESVKTSDEELVAWLYRAAELDELLQSISANGYMDIEALIVMDGPDAGNGELVVLEGNRRLAALRLLREPELAGRIASSQGVRIKVPLIDESTAQRSGTHTPKLNSQPSVTSRDGPSASIWQISPEQSVTDTIRSSEWCPRSTCWNKPGTRICSMSRTATSEGSISHISTRR